MSYEENYDRGLNLVVRMICWPLAAIIETVILILKSPFALLGWLFKEKS